MVVVGDIVRYLSSLARMHKDPKTGNPELAEALQSLAKALRPYREQTLVELSKALKEKRRIQKAQRSESADEELAKDWSNATLEEVEEALESERKTKQDLIMLGAGRFGISPSKLRQQTRIRLIESIRMAVSNERSLGTIAKQAQAVGDRKVGRMGASWTSLDDGAKPAEIRRWFFNHLLPRAERLFGRRDAEFCVGEIRGGSGEKGPGLAVREDLRSVDILLTANLEARNLDVVRHELAHECVHALDPCPREESSYLCEGLACWFQAEVTGQRPRERDSMAALAAVGRLMPELQWHVKRLRTKERIAMHQIALEHLDTQYQNISGSVREDLVFLTRRISNSGCTKK